MFDGSTVAAVGRGAPPASEAVEDLRGAVVTPGLVNVHHHLFQTLTRTRAQDADLFTWLRALYPVWGQIDEEAEYAAARTGLAELALSGCTTVFDHHYLFPRGRGGFVEAEVRAAGELGVRIVASRGSMDLGESDGGLDFWGEAGLGVEHLRWDAGGTLTRPDLSLGIGATFIYLGRSRHSGITAGLRITIAPRTDDDGAPPTCGGPCDTATPPASLDRSFLFDITVPFGT